MCRPRSSWPRVRSISRTNPSATSSPVHAVARRAEQIGGEQLERLVGSGLGDLADRPRSPWRRRRPCGVQGEQPLLRPFVDEPLAPRRIAGEAERPSKRDHVLDRLAAHDPIEGPAFRRPARQCVAF